LFLYAADGGEFARIRQAAREPREVQANAVRNQMSRRQDEQMALDIMAGRNRKAVEAPASRMSPIALVSMVLWLAVIVGIAAVATYFYRHS
jgi:hypothetical protein